MTPSRPAEHELPGTPQGGEPRLPGEHLVTSRRVRILSTKFDGSHHNEFEGRLLDDPPGGPEDAARVLVEAGTRMRSYRGTYTANLDFTMLFWPHLDRWWNLEHNHWVFRRPDGRMTTESYANVSTPATFDGETFRWVDLDLDVTVRDGVVELVDEDEFDDHRAAMAYPEEIVARARAAAAELLHLANARTPPFDRGAHIWRPRPASPLPPPRFE
ncbi:MAG: DUF402 domain-containing protein [Dehalococcoidia bacterium]